MDYLKLLINTLTSSVKAKDSEFLTVVDCWSLFSDSMLTSSSYKNKNNAILKISLKKDMYIIIHVLLSK